MTTASRARRTAWLYTGAIGALIVGGVLLLGGLFTALAGLFSMRPLVALVGVIAGGAGCGLYAVSVRVGAAADLSAQRWDDDDDR